METQVIVATRMEAPSIDIEHEEHKANLEEFKKKKKLESKFNTETNMGECSYRKILMPFHLEAKVDIKPYDGEVYAIKLNQWFKHMEMQFNVHEVTEEQRISLTRLNLEGHALARWESDAAGSALENDPLVND
jgi:hypothetical protein